MTEKSLRFGIELNKLKTAYDNFRKIPFPEPPIDDELYRIYSELAEFDAYIAGLISSFLKGKKITKSDLQMDENIKKNLINFETDNQQTKDEVFEYINYLNKLDELIKMVLNLI